MYNFERILVCLDLSEIDSYLLRAVSTAAELLDIERITFIHIVESLELPERIVEKYPDLIAPVDETVEVLIQKSLDKDFSSHGTKYDIEVVEGKPTEQILRWSNIKEVDLIIVGRKNRESGSGIFTEKVARLAHCSVAIIPPKEEYDLKKILVPVDFSDNSKMAVEEAIRYREKTNAEIICEHSYRVPIGYHSTGKSFEEFAEIMKSNAEHDFKVFLKKHFPEEQEMKCIMQLDEDNNPAKIAHNEAIKQNADMIIMGSKGRTGVSSVLLGSISEKMIQYDIEIPLLIVKNKEENMGFLEALLRI